MSDYKDNEVLGKMRYSLAMEIVQKLRNKGMYLFDNKELLEEYSEYFEDDIDDYQDVKFNKKLLSPILDVLPLAFTNISEFYKIVGKDNFDSFCDSFQNEENEECYSSINKMKESSLKNTTSTVVILDMPTIAKVVKSINDRKDSKDASTNSIEIPHIRSIPPTSSRRTSSILSRNINPEKNYKMESDKINKDIFKIENIKTDIFKINKDYDYYMDTNGIMEDDLDSSRGFKR